MAIDMKPMGRYLAHFSFEELRALCQELGIGFDELYLRGKNEFSHALVIRMANTGRHDDFFAMAEKVRPDLDWSDLKDAQRRSQQSFQDKMLYNHCWGCGPANGQGLQIKSYWQGEEAVSTFHPLPQHMAGPEHILNGGIIATIIDCHCVCTAIADAYRRQGREIGTTPIIWYATASMQINYRRPTPIEGPVLLQARIKSFAERKSVVTCDLISQDEVKASAELVAVRVPDSWLEVS